MKKPKSKTQTWVKTKGNIWAVTDEAKRVMDKKDYSYDPTPDQIKIFQAFVKFIFIMFLIAVIGYVLIILSVIL